ncbi:hypothetical protein [uncultured Methanobrevibacter sp.]|uniref:hypothetical protein n=1 Tax=uncultured Methanobrevibacter sp. TaxID=253161 RepID=UPI00260A0C11|nr:hypothetical protein [uncultured Methanobrevibacter sp.]
MLNYSNLSYHFTHWTIYSLVKTMSYPLFLFFVNISGIPYRLWMSLIWITSGLLITYGCYKFLTKNKLALLLVFLFILFLPVGFDSDCGGRIYRNAIITPFTIIFLATLFIFLNQLLYKIETKQTLFWAIILGLILTFNFYIKEDGILLLPIFLISILSILTFKILDNLNMKKELIKSIILCLIPIVIFGALTVGYEETNNHYFGISEINTRNGGEIGEFWENLLKIDDPNKTTKIWVPPTTIEKAYHASPTLQSRPDLLNNWTHSSWASGDMYKTPIEGDLVAWSLRESLQDVGLFDNEKTADNFFSKVNSELNDAFENGKLNKSSKIFITSSANGKNSTEINEMIPYIISGFKTCMFYNTIEIYDEPIHDSSQIINNKDTKVVSSTLNDDINKPKNELVIGLEKLNIAIYQVISYLLVALSAIGFITMFIHQIKNKLKDRKFNLLLGLQFLTLGTFIVQIIAIAWFCSWMIIDNSMKFYTVSCQGFFVFFEVISISSLLLILKENYKRK